MRDDCILIDLSHRGAP